MKQWKGQKLKNPQGSKWRRLDNTGKIFPLVSGEELSNVFRIAVTLKEEIQQDILQQALEDILPQFEGFRVRLKRGLFWYYFETNHRKIYVEKEDTYPCRYISHKLAPYYLFRVSYYKCRINVEIYHALSDGLGAVHFAKLLACRYLQIRHNMDTPPIVRNASVKAETEDSYLKYYKDVPKQKYDDKKAYLLEGSRLSFGVENIIHGTVPLKEVKTVCKQYGVSITKYLTAVLIWTIYEQYLKNKQEKPFIGVNLPINLRSMFESETLANFFAVTAINYEADGREVCFEDILHCVSEQVDEQIVREKLEERIAYNVSVEKKWYLKIVPLFIKRMALRAVHKSKDKGHTITLSNLGPIRVEEPYAAYIESFYVLIGVSYRQNAKCSILAYEEDLVITFATVFDDYKLAEGFFGVLRQHGILSRLESNGAVDDKYDLGRYPARQEIVRGSVKKEINFGKAIFWDTLLLQGLFMLLDYLFGWERISVNLVLPISMLLADLTITILMYFHRVKWQSYFMYQISATVLSLVPVLFVLLGLTTKPFCSILNGIIAFGIFGMTLLLRRKSTMRELHRRFHI